MSQFSRLRFAHREIPDGTKNIWIIIISITDIYRKRVKKDYSFLKNFCFILVLSIPESLDIQWMIWRDGEMFSFELPFFFLYSRSFNCHNPIRSI